MGSKDESRKDESRNNGHGTRRCHPGNCLREDRQEGKSPAAQTLHRGAGSDEAITASRQLGTNFPSDRHVCLAHEGTQVIGPTVQNISIPAPPATVSAVF